MASVSNNNHDLMYGTVSPTNQVYANEMQLGLRTHRMCHNNIPCLFHRYIVVKITKSTYRGILNFKGSDSI